ncbi:MAG: Ig-like domain-containing protein, partial [Rivularia sp. ALOHA_DT_140]|nr:Ig-like domain-containing protein [Rivularia sp. ALOHA_DT_140]
AARNTPASGLDDPLDLDGDGVITVLDARAFIVESQNNQDTTPPDITAALINDTGIDSTDSITFDPILGGTVTDNSPIVGFRAGFGNELLDISSTLEDDGSFVLDRDKLAEINGGELIDGEYTLMLVAEDQSGNSSSVFEVDFTLDSTAPILEVNQPSDNTVVKPGDSLIGTINEEVASLAYRFNDLTEIPITVENGEFDIALELTNLEAGSNTLTVIATDIAGNVTTTQTTVIIGSDDITAPVITAALVNDTGTSNSDGITSEVSIAGTVTDDSGTVVSLLAGFDNQLINFDVTEDLQADGSFSFNAAKLKEINGDVDLTQGEHTLKLIATDGTGNVSEVFNFTFNLDTKRPTFSIKSPAVDAQIAPGDKLVGTVNENLASLTYRFDNLSKKTVSVTDGTFAPELDLTGIGDGAHTLTITAKDLAGDVKIETLNVVVNSGELLRVTGFTPQDGATETVVTFRPQVFFSEAIDKSTLNQDNLFATASGKKNSSQYYSSR